MFLPPNSYVPWNAMSDSAKILVGKNAAEVTKHLCDAVERLFADRKDKEAAFVIGLSGGSLPKFFAVGAKYMKKVCHHSRSYLTAKAGWWKIQNLSQPNQGTRPPESTCTGIVCTYLSNTWLT